MELYSKSSHFHSSTTCYAFENTKNWNEYEIQLNNNITLSECKNDYEYLQYFRVKEKISYNRLGCEIGYGASDLKLIEMGKKEITRDLSKRLAIFFNTGTIYFYNNHYEETHNIKNIINTYLDYNRTTIKYISDKTGISYNIVRQWKYGNTYPKYEDYLKLKKSNIL